MSVQFFSGGRLTTDAMFLKWDDVDLFDNNVGLIWANFFRIIEFFEISLVDHHIIILLLFWIQTSYLLDKSKVLLNISLEMVFFFKKKKGNEKRVFWEIQKCTTFYMIVSHQLIILKRKIFICYISYNFVDTSHLMNLTLVWNLLISLATTHKIFTI
jgi:hypothetical protein